MKLHLPSYEMWHGSIHVPEPVTAVHKSIYVELCSYGFLNEDIKELAGVLTPSTVVSTHLRLSAMLWLSPRRDCTSE